MRATFRCREDLQAGRRERPFAVIAVEKTFLFSTRSFVILSEFLAV